MTGKSGWGAHRNEPQRGLPTYFAYPPYLGREDERRRGTRRPRLVISGLGIGTFNTKAMKDDPAKGIQIQIYNKFRECHETLFRLVWRTV